MTGGARFSRTWHSRPSRQPLDGVRRRRSVLAVKSANRYYFSTLLARSLLALALFLVAAPVAAAPHRRRSAMVSWSDVSDSSEHTMEYISSASDDGTIKAILRVRV